MRARNIKPGFYRDVDLADCSIEARYIVPGLWMMADREGRLKDNPRQIKMELCPCDDLDIERLLCELVQAGHIVRYEVEGLKVIQIRKFVEHQNPHKNEAPSTLPEHTGQPATLPDQSRSVEELPEHSSNYPSTPADSLNPDSLNPDSHILEGVYTPSSSAVDVSAPKDGNGRTPPCPQEQIIALYHEMMPELPQVRVWPEPCQKLLRTRWREDKERQSLGWWQTYFETIRGSPFLMGKEKDFQATLEWVVRPKNMAKILNGAFHRRRHGGIRAWLNETGSNSRG